MTTLNIYFIHASHLKDREKIMNDFKNLLGKYTFRNINKTNIKIIDSYDPQSINMDIIKKTVNYEPVKSSHENLSEQEKQNGLEFYNKAIKNLHIFQLSNVLKHYEALKLISEKSKNEIYLVLEDDILYEDRVLLNLDRILHKNDYGDILFLGLPSNTKDKNTSHKYQNSKELYRVLPYTDSYLITPECAKKLYDNFLPIKWIGNVQLSYILEKLNIQPKIVVPNIFIDGSKYGMFLSTLNANNQLLFNNDYMNGITILAKDNYSSDDKEKNDKLFEESQISQNPDFMHLHAKYLIKIKKYKKARDVFEKAIKIYEMNNNIINQESLFLKDYIRLYKYIQ